ncbi:hypothetical protein BJ875DRAFT_489873 [Amylocarpus encephaloides]|uniref:ARB-07466-like C-terminal domain-containing protein n=1 Tax=Amylocarpus encephaloides TaxID=45428 RepID=A0A9P8BZZ8_9HELO|nr:hypothetical protein BJ875DRAFT_489873 [Amylocarpus encephaloides]
MHITRRLALLLAIGGVHAAVNEPCVGSGGAPGVCVSSASCTSTGGKSISGACPSDPADIKCCTKTACSGGNCRWQSDCAGSSISNQCPGPGAFKCCQSAANGFGGYSTPSFPAVGACQQVSVDGSKRIVAAFPGRVHQVFCTRDCACGSGSDHCCGKASDIMCSDGGGVPTNSGQEIAEWVMNHRSDLNVKYVIWGQRIWESGSAVKPWANWKAMEDRGDITANHWQAIHPSNQ